MNLSILYFIEMQVKMSIKWCICNIKTVLILAICADTDKHLGLHCLPKYLFTCPGI